MNGSRWIETPKHQESLAVALRAVLARYGQDQPYENVLTALGLGTLVTAHADEPLRCWPTLGRDVRLSGIAELFGLRLRPLHPPDAAGGLGQSREFAGHFHDSYLPLIQTALAHEQPVLAWRGWPAPSSRCWGILTHEQDGRLFGYTLLQGGEPVPLIDPAHQVYVIEDYQTPARPLDNDELLNLALRHMHELWNGERVDMPGLLTGDLVYQTWLKLLRLPTPSDSSESSEPDVPLQHRTAVHALLAARRTLFAFLHSYKGRQQQAATRWTEMCEQVVERLAPYEASPLVIDDVERICADLNAVREIDRRAAEDPM